MIRGRDLDDVQVLLLKHLAVIGEGTRFLFRSLAAGDDVGRIGKHAFVDVAEGDDLDGGDLDEPEQVGLAVPAAADETDAARLVGREAAGRVGESSGGGEELSAIHEESIPRN